MKKGVTYTAEGIISASFLEVLPQSLTLRRRLPRRSWDQERKGCLKTPFREVSLVPYPGEVFTYPIGRGTFDDLYVAFRDAVYDRWDPKRPHIIGHSSGYDSRLMSLVVEDLKSIHGDQWYGNTLYVEVLGEGPEFKEIMKRSGIENYIAFNDGVPPGLFHADGFEFDGYFLKHNGISGFAVNMWWDAFTEMQTTHQIRMNYPQMFTGYGSNGMDEVIRRGASMLSHFEDIYYNQIQIMRSFGSLEIPFWDKRVINAMYGVAEIANGRIIEQLVRYKAPHLNSIPRLSVEDFCKRGVRILDSSVLKKAQQRYDSSWYGKKFKQQLDPDFYTYKECWARYELASLCETLLNIGYKIIIK